MHGTQPSPNTAPSSGAPHTPARGSQCSRRSCCSTGMSPTNASPIAIMTTPPTRCSTAWLSTSASASHTTPTRIAPNTTVNPATNNAAAPATRHRCRPDSSGASTPTRPAR